MNGTPQSVISLVSYRDISFGRSILPFCRGVLSTGCVIYQWRDHNTFGYKNISLFFIATKGSKRLHWHRVGDRHSECYLFFDWRFDTIQNCFSAEHQPSGSLLAICFPNLIESLTKSEWLPCHYIIWLTPTYFPSGSQFMWSVSAVPY